LILKKIQNVHGEKSCIGDTRQSFQAAPGEESAGVAMVRGVLVRARTNPNTQDRSNFAVGK
jgi:hypothetical protein